jgi:hypothetical protein
MKRIAILIISLATTASAQSPKINFTLDTTIKTNDNSWSGHNVNNLRDEFGAVITPSNLWRCITRDTKPIVTNMNGIVIKGAMKELVCAITKGKTVLAQVGTAVICLDSEQSSSEYLYIRDQEYLIKFDLKCETK